MPDTETEMTPTETDSSQVAQDVQNELMDMIIADESPAEISDRIKDMLFAKSAEKVDTFRPEVAASTFAKGETVADNPEDQVADAASRISGEDRQGEE
tara:strand:+ start:762 stop:1055 length:294 start_codon:yes stop_codon:yes gene_type:complete